ncbi:RNB domain-containing ribonuclease [SAR202 cluster bacterium AD-802-E10_MRT_200m]|nr:RNB domain-containing ribonuclease [SAR202 cluster bacterium AD-802-E10_MRT_200m]
MDKGRIVLFRRHGQYLSGCMKKNLVGNLYVSTENGKTFRINSKQVVTETDLLIEETSLNEWREFHEVVSEQIDFREIWELVQGEIPYLTLDQLGDLIWGSLADDRYRATLKLKLAEGTPYFVPDGNNWRPSPQRDLEQLFIAQERRRRSEEEETNFLSWLNGRHLLDQWTAQQLDSLESLRQLVIFGDNSPYSGKARGILRQLKSTCSDWQLFAFQLLVKRSVFTEDEPLGLYRLRAHRTFLPETLEQSKIISIEKLLTDQKRIDLTGLNILTIDEPSTKDIDDGLSIEQTAQGYCLGIHISDVSTLVPLGSMLDQEASNRLTSIYFPEDTIPMLPDRISEELGSLIPNDPRLAISVLIDLDTGFNMKGWRFVQSIIRSKFQYSYQEADEILETQGHPNCELLTTLSVIAEHFRQQRSKMGALELNRPDVKVDVVPNGSIIVSQFTSSTRARKLVAEFMILVNRLVGEFCRDNNLPGLFRSQRKVSLDDLATETNEIVWRYQVLRRLRPSELELCANSHSSLGVEAYIQMTSPVRRYQDLMMQRQISHFLNYGSPLYDITSLTNQLHSTDGYGKAIAKIEEERKRYWLMKYLSVRQGNLFQGVVLEMKNKFALVEICDYFLRARVYTFRNLEPGEIINLRLEEVDVWKLTLHFIVLD